MANQVTLKSGALTVDLTGFRDFARDLRKAEPVLAAGLKAKLRAVGMIVAERAKDLSGAASRTIAPSIKVRVSAATVSVVAGGNGIPLAGLMEMGNKGQDGASSFRHPVFGNKTAWVEQPTHPYLFPAVEESAVLVEAGATEALDAAIRTMTGD
jgi:hypothetical protein